MKISKEEVKRTHIKLNLDIHTITYYAYMKMCKMSTTMQEKK